MKFTETALPGVFIVDAEKLGDERGLFARTYCVREFEAHGITAPVVNCNVSFNAARGTLRGMHYQRAPMAEAKLVRCTRGRIFDVVVDLRPSSPTHRRWFATELTAANHRALCIPEGLAHGFQTLEDDCEVFYQMSEFYSPEHKAGVPFDDPAFGIEWPLPVTVMSERDRSFQRYTV